MKATVWTCCNASCATVGLLHTSQTVRYRHLKTWLEAWLAGQTYLAALRNHPVRGRAAVDWKVCRSMERTAWFQYCFGQRLRVQAGAAACSYSSDSGAVALIHMISVKPISLRRLRTAVHVSVYLPFVHLAPEAWLHFGFHFFPASVCGSRSGVAPDASPARLRVSFLCGDPFSGCDKA